MLTIPFRPPEIVHQPGVFVIFGDNLQRLSGAPNVIVEVISNDGAHPDHAWEFLEYWCEGYVSTDNSRSLP
ncbi:MAG: hypothetical protein RMM08_04245 [Armatimonadota bacterium]|nr:hypothetical protein [bacterium]MDW8320555.1 hypothetical protein [Armatimonadota bacterium]